MSLYRSLCRIVAAVVTTVYDRSTDAELCVKRASAIFHRK